MGIKNLKEQLEEYGITDIAHCICGAFTVTINRKDYSVHEDNFHKYFPNIDEKLLKKYSDKIMGSYGNCNWCVNHWGLDICACGSGEPYQECDNGFDECGNPMQSLESGYNHVRSAGSWI